MLPAPSSPLPSGSPQPPGRPRALDETKLREICALVTAGSGIIGAARYVGCATSTIRREACRNPDFNDRLRRASLAAELTPLNAVREAAKKYWRAGAWLLERLDAQRYGKQNVRLLKPEQFADLSDALIDVIKDEIKDKGVLQRIAKRFENLAKFAEHDAAARLQPCPKPGRRNRRR
jgi:hypothetical protein